MFLLFWGQIVVAVLMFPKITIITPSFNQGQYLEATLQSVLGQNYPNLEYFVIDGGSKDNSVEIIKKYESQLSFWVSEPDKGQSDAINKGLRQATGDIITWLNSDDQLTAGTLQKVATYFEQYPDSWVIHGKTILFGEELDEQEKGSPATGDLFPYYLAALPFPQPSSFFRKEAVQTYGLLNSQYHYGMDYDFFVRIALNHPFLAVEDVFSRYLLHPESKSVALSANFATDYAKIFCKVLRSVPSAQPLIKQLQKAKLYYEGTDQYSVDTTLPLGLFHQALLLNLKYQITFYYDALQTKEIRKIIQFIKGFDKNFLSQDPELQSVAFRSQLPKPLLQGLRWLKNR